MVIREHLAFALCVLSASNATALTIASSDFAGNIDGWSTSTGDQWIIGYIPVGGNPGGYVRGDDRPGVPSYYSAPAKFLGNWSSLNEVGELSWDIATLNLGPTPTLFALSPIARISGPGGSAVVQVKLSALPIAGVWRHTSLPVAESAWTLQSGTWAGLLGNITSLQINGEFVSNGSPPGAEIWGLDNVLLAAVPELPSEWLLLLGCGSMLIASRSRHLPKRP